MALPPTKTIASDGGSGVDEMRQEAVSSEVEQETTRIPSTLQAILHGGEGGMETIGVPLPLPDAVVRITSLGRERAVPDDAPARAAYREQLFRRVRSSDSVVRYYEHADGIKRAAAEAPLPVRLCCACGNRNDLYFVKTLSLDVSLTMESQAMCADCYVSNSNA